jgi:alanyl-tRNA synthetase
MTAEQIAQVERLVNEKIRQNIPVVIKEMGKEEAMLSGATALFGEKYGDTVRVVTIDPSYSVELCGGTHAGATGELGLFKITSETAVAAGVRRVEALCGAGAEQYINAQLDQLHQAKEALKAPKDLIKSIQVIIEENGSLKKQVESFEAAQLKLLRQSLEGKVQSVNGISFIGEVVEVGNADGLKKLAFDLRGANNDTLIVLGSAINGKAALAIAIADNLVADKGLDSVQIIKQHVAPLIKGGGGGQKNLATAGGQDTSALHPAIQTVKNLL